MAYAVLLMIGGTLLINGLAVLGHVRGNGAAIYNIFTGVLGTATPFFLLLQVPQSAPDAYDTVLSLAPMWLFALTFLWVGINSLTHHTPTGVGWYCLWVAAVAVGVAGVNFVRFDMFPEGIIWLNWALLWGLFWALLARGKSSIAAFTGWLAVILSIWTVTLQGFLSLVGVWNSIPVWVFVAATALTIGGALLLSRVVGLASDEVAGGAGAERPRPAVAT